MQNLHKSTAALFGLTLIATSSLRAADLPDPDGNGHYGKDSRVFMDVGLAMGEAMNEPLKNK